MKTNWPAIRCGCLLLGAVALTTPAVRAQAPETAGTPQGAAVISSVAVTQAERRASVRVEGEGRLDVRAARMQDPDRLVLDFNGARLAVPKTVIPGVAAPVRGVRVGQFKASVARVVIDLTDAAPYQISREDSAVVVQFTGTSTSPAAKPAIRAAEAHKEFIYTASAPHKSFSRASHVTPIPAPKFEMPSELTRPSAVLAAFGGANRPAMPERPRQQASNTSGNAASVVQQAGGPSAQKYTGEPISVNLKDVDLKDFFRLVHEISGLNVVLDPAVKGSLTIVLDDVPWDQALDIVLLNNNLDKQLTGNILRIATRDTLTKEAQTQRDLIKAQEEAVPQVTWTRVLSYAKAATMKDTLKKFLSGRGDILSDDRSNQLIIRDIPSVIPMIENLINKLDRKSQQVEIEARVVAASRSWARDIGTQFAFSTSGGNNIFGGNSAVGASPIFRTILPGVSTSPALFFGTPPTSAGATPTPANVQMPLISNLGAGAPTSGMSYIFTSPNFALDFLISAAEAKGVGKLLSKPKVITQNNEKAIVKQGTKVPIQTTINNTVSVTFIDAVLKLEVTPQITAEGTVYMDVLVENTQIDNGIPRVQGTPALDTQSAETKVTVSDGGTVVIGGIIISSQRTDITEVPIAGSLPIIGHLFRRTNVSSTSQELLFFVTPRIIPG